jgi:CRP/FNR family transcriptional regulator, cyclic AMP receptor protein
MGMDSNELERIGFVSGLTDDDRAALDDVFTASAHDVGTALIVEGGDPTKFFVLLEGNVTVHRDGAHVADLGPGDCFGEIGVVTLASRNATVIATTPVRVATAMGWDLRDLLDGHPNLRERVIEAIEQHSR